MNEFGILLKKMRLEHKETLRSVARKASISATYLSELERGVKQTPSKEILERIARALNLNANEKSEFFQTAARSQNTIAYDLPDYIMNRDYVASALRVAKELNAGKEQWDRFVEELYANEKKE